MNFIALLVSPMLLASISVAAQTQIPVKYVKLVRATNYVLELRARPERIDQQDAVLAAKLTCEGLREISADEDLRSRVAASASVASEHEMRSRAIREDLGMFLDEFLSPELVLLERSGLTSTAVRQIVEDSRTLKAQLYIGKFGKGSEETFFRSIETLTDEICRAAAQAQIVLDTKKSDTLFRVGVAGAGVLIVVANMYLTPTPTGALAVQSYSFGFSFVSGALLK